MNLINPISMPLEQLVPLPEDFRHPSRIHGQEHVSRVMIHAFLLLQLTRQAHLAASLWASVYLHDAARTHDRLCYRHGADAARRFSEFSDKFQETGLSKEDEHAVRTAVAWHAVPRELPREHRFAPLVHLLKDADALDRVRIGDLNPRFLRYPESHFLLDFAEVLFARSNGKAQPGADYFPWVWGLAQTICQKIGR